MPPDPPSPRWSIDARIPVVFGPAELAGPNDALWQDVPASPGHPVACACCVPRSDAAQALGALFLAQVRGEMPFFRRVVVAMADPTPVRTALMRDPLVAGRFRPE